MARFSQERPSIELCGQLPGWAELVMSAPFPMGALIRMTRACRARCTQRLRSASTHPQTSLDGSYQLALNTLQMQEAVRRYSAGNPRRRTAALQEIVGTARSQRQP